jgi:anti-sigma factor RsiW
MTTHLTRNDAARWVAGVLDDPHTLELEAHARACPACEELLREEARADALLTALVRQLPAPAQRGAEPWRHPLGVNGGEIPSAVLSANARVSAPRFGPRARAAVILVPLALAASLVLLFSQGLASTSSAASDAGALELSAPRYERGAQIPDEALTANEPFPL